MDSQLTIPSEELMPLRDLDDELVLIVGRIIIKHSYLELMLSRIAYLLAGVEPEVGRVAIREPRTSDRWSMIESLAIVRGIEIEPGAVKIMRKHLQALASRRDGLAHGTFFEHPQSGKKLIRTTKGEWQPPGMKIGKIKKAIHPSGDLLEIDGLKEISSAIDSVTDILEAVYFQVIEGTKRSK